jgi:hypothetical protein
MYLCLAESVDGNTKEKMESERSDYLARQAVVAGNVIFVESGLLYMKKLLDTAHANTRATMAHARSNLAGLDAYMTNLPESDIKEFKKYVKQQLQTLTARGETIHDLVTNLFKGYLSVKCEKFVSFIERKKDSFNANDIDFTHETLMAVAEKHYDFMKLEGAWNSVSPHEQHVLALTTKIAELEKNRKPPRDRGDRNKQQTPSERFKGEQAWKAIAPKNGEPHAKTVGKLTFHWCPHHGFWTAHKPSDCTLATTGAPSIDVSRKQGTKTPPVKPATKPPVSWAQATAAVIGNNNDDTNKESDS